MEPKKMLVKGPIADLQLISSLINGVISYINTSRNRKFYNLSLRESNLRNKPVPVNLGDFTRKFIPQLNELFQRYASNEELTNFADTTIVGIQMPDGLTVLGEKYNESQHGGAQGILPLYGLFRLICFVESELNESKPEAGINNEIMPNKLIEKLPRVLDGKQLFELNEPIQLIEWNRVKNLGKERR